MNILHLRASNFYGGPERQLHMHAREAQSSEFNLSVASFSENGNIPEFLEVIKADGIPTYCFQVDSAYDTKAISQLRQHLQEHAISVLCTHDYRTNIIGWLATRRTSVHWVAFSRGWTRENLKVQLYHTVDKFIIRFAKKIVAVSRKQGERLQHLLINKKRIVVIPNAVDKVLFEHIKPASLHERFNFPPDSFIGIAAGRFSAEKGQLILVKAAAQVLQQNNRLRIVMFGDGPDKQQAQELARKYQIADNVLFPGYEKNVIAYIKSADFLINPSLSEGLPNIVLEGMAVKTPVLATAVGGVPEIITHATTGYLVPPNNPEELAKGILYFLNHREIITTFANKALQFVSENLSFEKQNEQLCRLYRKLVFDT